MFVTFFEDIGAFDEKATSAETHGEWLTRRALSRQTITINTRNIDSVQRVFKNGEWQNTVYVFNGENSYTVSDETYLKIINSLTECHSSDWDGTEDEKHFKII